MRERVRLSETTSWEMKERRRTDKGRGQGKGSKRTFVRYGQREKRIGEKERKHFAIEVARQTL